MRASVVLCMSLALAACGGSETKKQESTTPAPASVPAPEPKADPMHGVHGMVVFGVGAKFVSHLPMYSKPHDAQVIAEVRLLQKPGEVVGELFAKPHELGYYTLRPEPFSLPEMKKEGFQFPATLYAGHYERDGHEEIGDVVVEIKRPIVYRELQGARETVYPAIVFGSTEANEFYMAHTIGSKPSFDQISLLAEGIPAGDASWANGKEVSSVAHPDEPIRRYGSFSFQLDGAPLRVKTRAVYTEIEELQ